MKAPLWIAVGLICLAYPAVSQEIHDYRIVNGITVDLAPVRAWLSKPKGDREGDRPMKHWRQLQVVELKEQVGSWTKCLVKTEENTKAELFITSLPAEVKRFFQSVSQQYQAIQRTRVAVESDTRKIRQLDGTIPVAAGGSALYVDTVMSQRAQLETWKANLETLKEELAKAERAYYQTLEDASQQVTVLAMFSGRKYLNIEIWDCGQKKL